MSFRRLVAPLALILAACGGTGQTTTTTAAPTTTTTTSTTVPSTTTTTLPETVEAAWVLMTEDGLLHHFEGPIGGPGAVGWHTIARDRRGGFAYLADGSLWWQPARETEPREVAPAEGDLVEVIPTEAGPVARIGFCDSDFISLETGEEVRDPGDLMVEASCTDGEHVWNAANGLQATIAGPGVLFDSEGEVAGIEDVAELHILQDGEVVAEIPVGGFYEAYARIHDFDGRFVIISRGPFEPAMPEETYFLLDLETGETLYPGEHAGASASLLGRDVDGVPSLPEARYVHHGEPMFTDDRVADLPDGTYLGYVTYAAEEGFTGLPEIQFDLVVWFGGKEADYAALEDGEESPRPNGYYIRNDDSLELVLRVADRVEVTSVWYHYVTGLDLVPLPITFAQFVEAMTGEPSGHQVNMVHDPWWVTIVDGEIVSIEEQYIP